MTIFEYFQLLRSRGRLVRSVRFSLKAERHRIAEQVNELAPWFHNYELASGVWTDPNGDGPGLEYPAWRWGFVSRILPDVREKSCLDVGCSSGFFSIKLKELGATHVLGVDDGEQLHAIDQGQFAANELGLDIEFQKRSIYDLSQFDRQFDLAICLGGFYHLQHPLLALQNLRAVCRDTLILQTITTRHNMATATELPREHLANVELRSEMLSDPAFPALRFIEQSLGSDSSCWFIPNPEAIYAMLRASGFKVEEAMFPGEYDILVRCTVDPRANARPL